MAIPRKISLWRKQFWALLAISLLGLMVPSWAAIKIPSLIVQNENRTTVYGTGATPKRKLIIHFDGEVDIVAQGATHLAPATPHKHLTQRCPAGQTCISLAWHPFEVLNATLKGYQVFRSTDPENFPLTAYQSTDPEHPQITDTDLLPGTTYHYLIRAVLERSLNGQTITTVQTPNDTPVRIISVLAPPEETILLHRWMANKAICGLMQKTLGTKGGVDPRENFRCTYNGLGAMASNGTPCTLAPEKTIVGTKTKCYYDFGRDLLIDQQRLDDNPTADGTQSAERCHQQSFALAQGPFNKRTFTRAELVAIAATRELNSVQRELFTPILGQGYFWGADYVDEQGRIISDDQLFSRDFNLNFDGQKLPASSGNFQKYAYFNAAFGLPLLANPELTSDDQLISYSFTQEAQLYFTPAKPVLLELPLTPRQRFLVGGNQGQENSFSLRWALPQTDSPSANEIQIFTRCGASLNQTNN